MEATDLVEAFESALRMWDRALALAAAVGFPIDLFCKGQVERMVFSDGEFGISFKSFAQGGGARFEG